MGRMSDTADLIAEAGRLGEQVNGHPENLPLALPRLLAMLDESDEPEALASVIAALGHAWDERASLAVLRFASHPDEGIRLTVAQAAPGGVTNEEAEVPVADALIDLSSDPVDEIRDWATFGLGSMLNIDSPKVREALASRLEDGHFDTRCEAIVGLAERKDERALEPTLLLLDSESVPRLAVDAARALGDPRLVPALRRLESWWDVDADLVFPA